MRPGLRHAVGHQPVEEGLGARPGNLVFGEVGDLGDADAVRAPRGTRADMLEIVGAVEGDDVLRLDALGREPERRLQAPGVAHHGALRDHHVVERRRLLRPRGRQLLVGEADREAARIVLAHLGVGVAQASPIRRSARRPCPRRRSRDRRRPSSCDSARPTPPPWLKPAITAQAHPEIGQALHRPDQRIAVGREGEGAVDDLLDAGLLQRREMLEADLERRRDAVEVGRQQLVAEIPRRRLAATTAGRPSRRCRAACRCAPGACRSRP